MEGATVRKQGRKQNENNNSYQKCFAYHDKLYPEGLDLLLSWPSCLLDSALSPTLSRMVDEDKLSASKAATKALLSALLHMDLVLDNDFHTILRLVVLRVNSNCWDPHSKLSKGGSSKHNFWTARQILIKIIYLESLRCELSIGTCMGPIGGGVGSEGGQSFLDPPPKIYWATPMKY